MLGSRARDGRIAAPHRSRHQVSVVVPVYQGEHTLGSLVDELLPLTEQQVTAEGLSVPDRRDRARARRRPGPLGRGDPLLGRPEPVGPAGLAVAQLRPACRDAGRHGVVGIRVDRHDGRGRAVRPEGPRRAARHRLAEGAALVYGTPSNPPPHGPCAISGPGSAKFVGDPCASGSKLDRFSQLPPRWWASWAAAVAAYVGPGVYLDVALSWVVPRTALCPVPYRTGTTRPSGYTFRELLSHFWQLVITSGTRPLRIVSLVGGLLAIVGFVARRPCS